MLIHLVYLKFPVSIWTVYTYYYLVELRVLSPEKNLPLGALFSWVVNSPLSPTILTSFYILFCAFSFFAHPSLFFFFTLFLCSLSFSSLLPSSLSLFLLSEKANQSPGLSFSGIHSLPKDSLRGSFTPKVRKLLHT